jgi:molybdate transport system substrate-binding protein
LGGLSFALAEQAEASEPGPVQVYAAMTFRPALDSVLAAWRDAGGAAVGIYAPTPVLVRQLAAGAPADILLTADPSWMDQAMRQELVQPDTRGNLMANDLVLAGPSGSATIGTVSAGFPLPALLGDGRLAMCDPVNDPAGRYAKQSLQALGFWDRVASRIAVAESAPAAVVLVETGEAAAAICFATDLHGARRAIAIGAFPAGSHAPIVYPAALAQGAPNRRAAEALAFLRSPPALRIFYGFGYRPAD